MTRESWGRNPEEIADEVTEDEQFKKRRINDKQTLYTKDHTGEIVV